MKGSKNLTVRQLRELARKHLGRGHSKLKTKADLLVALKKWLPQALRALAAVRSKAKASAPPPKRSATRSKKILPMDRRPVPVEVLTFPRPEETRAAAPQAEQAHHRAVEAPDAINDWPRPAEPIIEGFFIARVAGEGEARRHHLVEGTARRPQPQARLEDGLGELPTGYEDDSLRALARDPSTLFVLWDFHPRTLDRAAAELKSRRAVLRIYDGALLVREADVAIESRSFYVHGLAPGRRYRVEAHWVGLDGLSKLIARSKGESELPRADDEPRSGEARFAVWHWDQPLGSLGAGLGTPRVLSEEDAGDLARRFPRSRADAASDRSQWTAPPAGRLMPKQQAEELARRIPRARAAWASDQSRWTAPASGRP